MTTLPNSSSFESHSSDDASAREPMDLTPQNHIANPWGKLVSLVQGKGFCNKNNNKRKSSSSSSTVQKNQYHRQDSDATPPLQIHEINIKTVETDEETACGDGDGGSGSLRMMPQFSPNSQCSSSSGSEGIIIPITDVKDADNDNMSKDSTVLHPIDSVLPSGYELKDENTAQESNNNSEKKLLIPANVMGCTKPEEDGEDKIENDEGSEQGESQGKIPIYAKEEDDNDNDNDNDQVDNENEQQVDNDQEPVGTEQVDTDQAEFMQDRTKKVTADASMNAFILPKLSPNFGSSDNGDLRPIDSSDKDKKNQISSEDGERRRGGEDEGKNASSYEGNQNEVECDDSKETEETQTESSSTATDEGTMQCMNTDKKSFGREKQEDEKDYNICSKENLPSKQNSRTQQNSFDQVGHFSKQKKQGGGGGVIEDELVDDNFHRNTSSKEEEQADSPPICTTYALLSKKEYKKLQEQMILLVEKLLSYSSCCKNEDKVQNQGKNILKPTRINLAVIVTVMFVVIAKISLLSRWYSVVKSSSSSTLSSSSQSLSLPKRTISEEEEPEGMNKKYPKTILLDDNFCFDDFHLELTILGSEQNGEEPNAYSTQTPRVAAGQHKISGSSSHWVDPTSTIFLSNDAEDTLMCSVEKMGSMAIVSGEEDGSADPDEFPTCIYDASMGEENITNRFRSLFFLGEPPAYDRFERRQQQKINDKSRETGGYLKEEVEEEQCGQIMAAEHEVMNIPFPNEDNELDDNSFSVVLQKGLLDNAIHKMTAGDEYDDTTTISNNNILVQQHEEKSDFHELVKKWNDDHHKVAGRQHAAEAGEITSNDENKFRRKKRVSWIGVKIWGKTHLSGSLVNLI